MPIYEFYCEQCHTIYNFFSKRINTSKIPLCPHCQDRKLERQMSAFAVTGRAQESDGEEALPFDEAKMEKAMQMLAGEAENINEEDPRQAADLMRRLTDMTGMEMGEGMQEALDRMEAGEDPEEIEAAMGDRLEQEDPFSMPVKKGGPKRTARPAPHRDETLYDLI